MDDMKPYRIYELSFRDSGRAHKPPELVFSVSQKNLGKLIEYLRTSRITEAAEIPEYVGEHPSISWIEPCLPLDRNQERFGLAQCAYVVTKSDVCEICLPLLASNTRRIAKTLQMLLWALNWLIVTNEETSNAFQLCDLSGKCDRSGWHSHSMGGQIFPVFRRWLAILSNERRAFVKANALLAMRSAWYSLNAYTAQQKEKSKYERFIARMEEDGRFHLQCPGDASYIEVSTYDIWTEDIADSCNFSCHNLDDPYQQLTLLSGLAMLHMCAIEGLE